MKKFIVFAVVLALSMLPAAAFAKAEFSLGGYIKLDTFWDSTQNGSLIFFPTQRDNDGDFHHGRFNMRAQESRFNFTIKGPKVFGAILTGFMEMDFDGTPDSSGVSASGTWNMRLRHAMFRLTWPETELLFGQYWGLFTNWVVDAADDGPFMPQGLAIDRVPQIRVTQKIGSDWSVAGMISLPVSSSLDNTNPYGNNTSNNGSAAETPNIQGLVKYSHDWYGKAAYFGHPIPLTFTLAGGWERNIVRYEPGFGLRTFGDNQYLFTNGDINQRYVSSWMAQAGVFIPVLPTHTANLAGTASLMAQWFIGQGVEAFGIYGNNFYTGAYSYTGTDANGINHFEGSPLKRFGGYIQGQYYFTNQWYFNAAWGITRVYGLSRDETNPLAQTLISADMWQSMQQIDATLWYRPIQALKFGLQYTYARTKWLQITENAAGDASDVGNEHRVEFVGYFFF